MTDKNTAFPVRKMLWLTEKQWEQINKFRHENMIGSEAEALRQLIKIGLQNANNKR
jgi:hypothetical protein